MELTGLLAINEPCPKRHRRAGSARRGSALAGRVELIFDAKPFCYTNMSSMT